MPRLPIAIGEPELHHPSKPCSGPVDRKQWLSLSWRILHGRGQLMPQQASTEKHLQNWLHPRTLSTMPSKQKHVEYKLQQAPCRAHAFRCSPSWPAAAKMAPASFVAYRIGTTAQIMTYRWPGVCSQAGLSNLPVKTYGLIRLPPSAHPHTHPAR